MLVFKLYYVCVQSWCMEQIPYPDVLGVRDEDATKGENGEVVVIGGSEQYLNTPAIAALGAIRAGCDVVRTAAPAESAPHIASFALDLIPVSLEGEHLQDDHVGRLVPLIKSADCAVIGPGIGTRSETWNTVQRILDLTESPLVVDADALPAIKEVADTVRKNIVLTPHATEFETVASVSPPTNLDARKEMVARHAEKLGCTIMLKGATDVISDGDQTETNTVGTPYLAKGGTGDVLAGITASLIAQGNPPFESACTAAWVNGTAGNEAVDRYGRGFVLDEHLQCVSDTITTR